MAIENSFKAHGTTNGTSDVTMLAAPGQGQIRRVQWINVHNNDSGNLTYQIDYLNGASRFRLKTELLATKANAEYPSEGPGIVLDETDTSLVITLTGAAAADEPDWILSYEEETREAVVN